MTSTMPIGSISHGTLRSQDLIPTFLDTLRQINPNLPIFGRFPTEPSDEWYDTDEAAEILSDLFDALNDAAPDNCYFGAHEGDGADFGFWPIDTDEDGEE